MHLNASLAGENRITPICNSHEQASAICSEGYAKATNGLGVCLVTTGPGGTNAVTGVAGAWLDSTPVLFLSGQVKRPDRMFDAVTGKPLGMRQLGVQEVDICSIVRPITKYAEIILEPADVRYHLEKAVYLAMNGRPGPVWIDIPLDVQASPIDETSLREFDAGEFTGVDLLHGTSNVRDAVARAIEAFNACERPLLFAGNGIRLARAEKEFEELRRYLGVPTVATWCAADLVPSDDPTYVGRPGSVAARGANFALQNCDWLLAIGVRLDFAITGYATYVVLLTLLNAALPARWLYLTVVMASVLGAPLNITVAFLGYKFFVFRTEGNYLREWLKCFAVYGSSMVPGLVALSALTRVLQSVFHSHSAWLHGYIDAIERHLGGRPLAFLHYVATGKAMAGYTAGAIVIGVSTIYSFVGHKKITFRTRAAD